MSAAPLLKVLRDGQTVREEEIKGEIDLGRGEGCVIRLDDRAISRRHVVIRPVEGGIEIEKKSEFAPMSVNGSECTRAVVKEADVVSIGPYLVRVSIPKPEPVAAPAPTPPSPAPTAVSASDFQPLDAPTAILPEDEALKMPTESQLNDLEPIQDEAPAIEEPPVAENETPSDEGGLVMEGFDESAPASDGVPGLEGMEGLEAQDGDGVPGLDFSGDGGSPDPGSGDAESGPDMSGFDSDDGATRLTPAAKVSVKLVIEPGRANVTELEITKDEIVIGRGKGCDIVLEDKKSSRKNTLVRKAGLSFIVKDLESANGTLVNGLRVQEQELSGDDVIRVGDTEIQFKATSVEYEQAQHGFAAVSDEPPEGMDEGALGMDGGMDFGGGQDQGLMNPEVDPATGLPMIGGAVPGIDPAALGGAIPGVPKEPPKGGLAGLRQKWQNMSKEQRKKIMLYLVLGVALWDFMGDEAPPPKKAAPKKQAKVSKDGKISRSFEMLSPDKKKFVEAQHALAFDLYRSKDYDKALFEIQKIFQLVDEFKNSREIERYAQEGKRKMEALEEEKRRKEEEARLKAKIGELVEEAGRLMVQKSYDQAEPVFGQILALDPENQMVSTWQREITKIRDEETRKRQEKEIQEKINILARDLYQDGIREKEKGRLREAIAVFKKVPSSNTTDKELLRDAEDRIEEIRAEIKSQLDPVLEEAIQMEESKQFPEAFNLYEKAKGIDQGDPRGKEGMDRIRGVLDDRAKAVYVDAVVAESYSDFQLAKTKYEEVMKIAPKDSIHYERAKRKLIKYGLMMPAEGAE